ncbi:hypothetical protein AB0E08_47385 [Streptomyces sp. NPDC048281]|uniref:hypothetical protein n=1 Tax=Streptomyces sp. NPDC048281 TaxID=3154715 RepID=UPI003434DC09
MGLLRDARRVLTGDGFARPEEVAAACVRSAADALLGLPGAPVTVGLKPAAQGLLAAVDDVELPAAEVPGRDVPAGTADGAAGACPAGRPSQRLPVGSHRRRQLKRHAGLVVAALRQAEGRIDVEGAAVIPELARLLMKIADRYVQGHLGALLDNEELTGLEAVRDWEAL